jgi:hypothetical protein
MSEILDRVIRIETRLMKLGDVLGVNLRSKDKITVTHVHGKEYDVEISALDVSISAIISACKEQGISGILVNVHYGDDQIADVWVA